MGEKRPLPWVENGFDFNRRPQSWMALLKCMLLALFADRNLSRLRLAHLFTRIPAGVNNRRVGGVQS